MFISPVISSIVRPFASSSPTCRLRLSGLMHVASRSPIPASPANVWRSPPIATPSRAISASARAITSARVLSPVPRPAAIPAEIANTFFERARDLDAGDVGARVHAEHGAREDPLQAAWASRSSGIASTAAAAYPWTISLARFGPASTPAGWLGSTSSITSVIRWWVPCSSPFVRLTIGTHGRTYGAACSSTSRKPCDGTAITSTSAVLDRVLAGRSVASSASSSGSPGR